MILTMTERADLSSNSRQKKRRINKMRRFYIDKTLAVTYFRMGKPHTIIGDAPFHF